MGSIQVEEFLDQGKPNAEDFRPYTILGLAPDQTTPTGLKEEVLLLSWLIALLRTREGSQISYEWAYGNQPELTKRSLSLDKPKIGLETSVEEAATAIANYLATFAPIQKGAESHPTSLLLSTGSLSQTSEAKDEGAIHLEVRFDHPRLEIRSLWQTENVLPYTVTRHIETLVDVVKLCIANSHFLIQNFYLRPTEYDLDSIWGWNHLLPPTYKFCMHEMVTERAHKSPDKEAICSWDGSLTYAQVDRYSTLVASLLKELGVRLHDVLPVCFEKSRWTSVAVLAVMKSGATFVLMDPTLPLARLQNMAHQVDAKMMLSSRKQRDLSTLIMPDREPFVVESDTFADPSKLEPLRNLSPVPSSALMYMIFTSGSTGSPKGVKLSHETYTSSAIPRAKEVGYTENSRVLDFASYAFDVSIDSMLLTLGNGGCLCIPSDENRMNDINGVIRNMRVNYAGLTPSVGRILDPDVIASLEGFGLGGEAVSARDCTVWGKLARIIIGYGPCECTIGCTVNGDAATGRDYISIGKGNGAAIWITDPNDHESLVPVGAVGELLVEGPIVGQGYLNDPEKTAAAFIEDPKWLVTGHKSFSGRRGRLYKTGDLGKYDPDGSGGIVFVGRKDTQVKLRGQRVELGEIESQLRAKLPSDVSVIAEVIVPKESGGQPTLVAFVAVQSTKKQDIPDLQSQEFPEDLRKALSNADAEVAKVLPRYMVPTAYIPVNYMPVLISGKTDRKRLREFGTKVDLRQVDQGSSSNSNSIRELSEPEQRMRKAWGETLKRDPETIQPNDNFFALGGDSVMAMKLVSISRAHGMEITVANTFNNPILSEMASVVQVCNSEVRNETPPFSMIAQTVDSATLEAAHACGTEPTAIEDIYPCTPTQESLFTFSLKAVVAYVAQRVSSIPPHIDLDSWKRAWEGVVAASPILRTRIAQLSEPGLQQIILKEGIPWKHSTDLGQYLEDDRNEKMELGQSLARYAIIESDDGKRHMVWTIHHVVYDGWSEPIVLQKVTNALKNQPIELQSQMREFVRYVHDTDQTSMQEFWRRELRGAVGPQFPRLPTRDYLPTPDGMVERQVELEMSAGSPFTMATLIRGAWSLVASQYTGSDDIVFGETVMGRDIVLPGVEGIIGPLIATVPVRVHVHRTSSVEAYLQSVQQAMLTRIPYQHMGMQNIRKVSHDAQHACETGTGLVIQPEPVFVGSELGFEVGDVVREALHFNPYPVMLGCGIRKGGFRICASFDTSLVEVAQMERILAQVETTCVQLSKDTSQRISEISCLPEAELNQIWRWNKTSPLSLDESGKPRADASLKQGSIYPPAVVPWVCDPRNPSRLSPIGCIGELWLEGALLSGETVESPAWLVAGSSSFPGRAGKVQSTGDMVQLREDGTLVLFGRKENFVGVQGHAVDIADLEAHLKRQLPPTVIAAAAVPQAPWEEPELVIFVEEQSSEGNKVKLMSEPLGIEGSQTSISAVISIELALALKKLDKFIRDNLPAYMAPSTYIVVDHVPNKSEEIDHNLLNQIASKVPRQVFSRLREGFEEVWKNVSAQTKLTANESILQAAWANVLRIDPRRIDVDDNFFRLGGDSVLAMKLVSSLRAQAHSLSVADIFQHMRLGDAAKMLRVGEVPKKKEAYKPFSTLGSALDLETFLSETVQPKLSDSSWSIRDVCPVTDSQALDVRATVSAPRTSIQYTMLYFDKNIDGEKLLLACNNLVKTHDILRTVFIEHDSRFLQVVLETLETPITKQQTDQDLEQYVAQLCTTDIESIFELGSPLLRFFHVENITDGQHSLVLRLSHAQYDGISLPRLLRDLETLYTGHTIENYEHFPSYISQIHDKTAEAKAITYWRNLLADSTLSILPGKSPHNPSDQGVFHSKQASTAAQPFEEITTASLLTAAWAVLLARRLRKTDIAFGSVTSGRILEHIDNTENIVGPTYQITPVRIPFQSTWTPTDLLHFVQSQSASSAAHDFLGFDRISKHCTQWPAEAYFDSMVHHQDHEDFDTMSFVGEECKVDIANPHGDAAYPVKVVSFVRGGRLHFGVVGSERDVPFVDEVLDQLVNTAEELVRGAREVLVLGS
ncbi:nonribosomal peptide synthase SidD [Aspergillus lucknowensis]|uniref:Carrier domain-containing protein n=1 Tax=Aspergillus lucknowensis TaxID=176173 RepID=A0ABR4M8A9_9EURO